MKGIFIIYNISCGAFFTVCGSRFTVCVDHEGFMWSFGQNNAGQLVTGNKTSFNVPQKILEIPTACGYDHTLIITNDDNLWSCGYNEFGQLCLGNQKDKLKPSFSNISKVSGYFHSIFQNNNGEYFHVVIMETENVDWVISNLLKSHQVSLNKIPNIPPIKAWSW